MSLKSLDLKKFVREQKNDWRLSAGNYAALERILVKKLKIDSNEIIIQCNPERMKSSTAAVDKESVKKRKCFLCDENRPAEQDEIIINNNYKILLNPFPIFDPHFTLTARTHKDQLIFNEIDDLINTINIIGEQYTVFYNGPECGASAPDHMHFQVCNRKMMPIESEYLKIKMTACCNSRIINGVELNLINDGIRCYAGIEFSDLDSGRKVFADLYSKLKNYYPDSIEPKINLIAFKDGNYIILVFPRDKHRPDFYFKEGDEKLLISPAAVDMGGIVICPRLEDFNKIDDVILTEMYNQICIKKEKFSELLNSFN